MTCNGASIIAKETNDYSFSSTITLPPVTVKPMSNLTFDWSGVSKDFSATLQPGISTPRWPCCGTSSCPISKRS